MSLLTVKGLVKYYARRAVVNGVDFEVNKGEVVGLLGPNGAGKTTSFRMATGQITPNAGTVWFNGEDVTHQRMFERARLGMGYLPQEHSIFRKLNCEQNILAVLELVPKLRSLGRAPTKAERYERMEAAIMRFGLNTVRKNVSERLSGGEKRRLEIARCLVCEPMLILFDEPFTGIDPITIAEIRQIILELRNEGIGVLLTDHNVHEALKITTRSYLIKDGKVRTHGTPAQIVRDPIAIAEYLGSGFNDHNYGMPSDLAAPTSYSSPLPTGGEGPGVRGAVPSQYSSPLPTGGEGPGVRGLSPAPPPAAPSVAKTLDFTSAPAKTSPAQIVLEQEMMARLVENLKTTEQAHAAEELVKKGMAAIPALLSALERRDAELRQYAVEVLQTILKHPIPFDAFAPESARKTQLAALRELFERKAG